MTTLLPTSTLFPYTTLFRSGREAPHHALRLPDLPPGDRERHQRARGLTRRAPRDAVWAPGPRVRVWPADRKSTRLNSSHLVISYAVFCLKKKRFLIYSSAIL